MIGKASIGLNCKITRTSNLKIQNFVLGHTWNWGKDEKKETTFIESISEYDSYIKNLEKSMGTTAVDCEFIVFEG